MTNAVPRDAPASGSPAEESVVLTANIPTALLTVAAVWVFAGLPIVPGVLSILQDSSRPQGLAMVFLILWITTAVPFTIWYLAAYIMGGLGKSLILDSRGIHARSPGRTRTLAHWQDVTAAAMQTVEYPTRGGIRRIWPSIKLTLAPPERSVVVELHPYRQPGVRWEPMMGASAAQAVADYISRRGIPLTGADANNLGIDTGSDHNFSLRTADFEDYDPNVAPAETRPCPRCRRPAPLHDVACPACGALIPRLPS